MKVKILEGGLTAIELNKHGNTPQKVFADAKHQSHYSDINKIRERDWQEAESKLRTFTIVSDSAIKAIWGDRFIEFEPGSIHDAEIIEGTKIKILR